MKRDDYSRTRALVESRSYALIPPCRCESAAVRRGIRSERLTALALGLCFGIAYYALGTGMAATGVFEHKNDLMFTADLKRGVEHLTEFGANHWRTRPHPLFVLLFNPTGTLLTMALGSQLSAAVAMSSTAGGVCVYTCYMILRQIQLPQLTSVLLTAILGSSAAHVCYSAIPESYIFAAASLLLLYFALVCRAKTKWFVAASLLAMGILISNLAQACLVYFCGVGREIKIRHRVMQVARIAAIVLVLAGVLNVVQRCIYNGSGLFFHPNAVLHERKFLYFPDTAADVLSRAESLSLHVFIYSFVAPLPTITVNKTDGLPSVTFSVANARNWRPTGALAAAIIALLLAATLWPMIRHRLVSDPLVQAVLLCLAFNAVLHSVYGDQLFLYACNWTAGIVLLVGRCWRPMLEYKKWSIVFNGTLALLFAAMLVNNVAFFQSLIDLYSAK